MPEVCACVEEHVGDIVDEGVEARCAVLEWKAVSAVWLVPWLVPCVRGVWSSGGVRGVCCDQFSDASGGAPATTCLTREEAAVGVTEF